jgi:ATP-dependent DNA helicase RecQ
MPPALSAQLDAARRLLKLHFGYPDFRPAQSRVIQSILGGHDTLAVLPTGGGKSICFQIPALVNGGLTLVVSPLISLMQDQVEALKRKGVAAEYLNSTLDRAQAQAIMQAVAAGSLRLLYVSPERLATLAGELRRAGIRPSLLAVDEAHCISEWGHDFRPSYRELAKARYLLGGPQVAALTGSATPEVRDDIAQSLRLRQARLVLGSFDRPNLWFGVIPVSGNRNRLSLLLELLAARPEMSIVYAPTRGQTELITQALRERGYRTSPYHAGLPAEVRQRMLHAFLADQLDVIVATSAFGMGIDKPNVRLVVHWTMSPTMESYYQEAGRAGRNGQPGRCIILHHPEDTLLARRQLDTTFPSRRLLQRIWESAAPIPGVSSPVLESADRLRREFRPQDGPVEWKRLDRRRRKAAWRLTAMDRYARSRGCRRRMLVEYFGQRAGACSGCDRCDN